jgi:hypothetical protein
VPPVFMPAWPVPPVLPPVPPALTEPPVVPPEPPVDVPPLAEPPVAPPEPPVELPPVEVPPVAGVLPPLPRVPPPPCAPEPAVPLSSSLALEPQPTRLAMASPAMQSAAWRDLVGLKSGIAFVLVWRFTRGRETALSNVAFA